MSILGRSSQRTPGSLRRRGPTMASGPARSDQIGSVKMWEPLCWSRTVEWLIMVTRSWSPSTRDGGLDGSTSETNRADGSGRLVSFHRKTSRKPRAEEALESKKRFPSKCLGNGGAPAPCCTISIYSQFSGWGGRPRVVEADGTASGEGCGTRELGTSHNRASPEGERE